MENKYDSFIHSLPMSLPYYHMENCDNLAVRPAAILNQMRSADYNDCDYWDKKYYEQLRVIHLTNFMKYLRSKGVSPDICDEIAKNLQNHDCSEIAKKEENQEIDFFLKISGKYL
jgi:hypothetical protein